MDTDDKEQGGLEEGPEVFDFLDALYEDLEAGEEHDLNHYLQRFPGREEAISREFEAQRVLQQNGQDAEQGAFEESLVGPYELVAELGRGGQGVVYIANDTRIERRVALKVLPPAALLLSKDRRHRLRREAEVISRLAHPGICGIFDAEIGEELAYIAMPLVEGRTLSSIISAGRSESSGGQGPPAAVQVAPRTESELFALLEFFEEAARALHSAHEVGVVHRDIKPGNLMVTPEGKPVWLDFGQARDAESSIINLTLSGEIFGTPAYMSPEQVMGGTVALQTDIWALGVSLFEALTLNRPFQGANAHSLLLSIQSEDPLSAQELNPIVGDEVNVVIETALERDLTRRYTSALEFAEELARLRNREPILARPAGNLLRLRRWIQRHPVLFLGIVGMIVGLIVTSGLLWSREQALEHALGRHLAERSEALLGEDPAAALVLGIEAVEHASNYLTRGALFAALDRCQLRTVYEGESGSLNPNNRVVQVSVVPGDRQVVAARSDGTVCLYDLLGGQGLETWSAHKPNGEGAGAALVVTCSSDGRWVASGGADGCVYLRDLTRVSPDQRIEVSQEAVTQLRFGQEDRTIAASTAGGAVRLLEVATGDVIAVLKEGGESLSGVMFDSAGGVLVESPTGSGALDSLRIWDGLTGALRSEHVGSGAIRWASVAGGRLVWIEEEQDRVQTKAMGGTMEAPDHDFKVRGEFEYAILADSGQELLVFSSLDGEQQVELLDLEGGMRSDFPAPVSDPVLLGAFSPGGGHVAVLRQDGVIRVWDVANRWVLSESRGYILPKQLEWTRSEQFILAARNSSPRAQLYYATQKPDVYRVYCGKEPVIEVAYSSDGEFFLTRDRAGGVRVWCASEGRAPGVGQLQWEIPGAWRGAEFSPAGTSLLVWGDAGAKVWSAGEGGELQATPDLMRGSYSTESGAVAKANRSSIAYASHHPNGDRQIFLTLDDDGSARLLGEVTGGRGGVELSPVRDVTMARFSPAGDRVITIHADHHLRCWDLDGVELWASKQVDADDNPVEVHVLAFEPGGESLAVGRSDMNVRFLRMATRDTTVTSRKFFPISSIDWSSDGRHFLVTGPLGRGAVKIIDLSPPNPAHSVMRAEAYHSDVITSSCFSPDGTLALTTSQDGTIMIRDVTGREESRATKLVAQIRGNGSAILCAGFSRGDRPLEVVAGFEDGTAAVWPVNPLEAAKRRKPRELADWEMAREIRLARPLRYR